MKRIFLLSAILILNMSLLSCTSNDAGQVNSSTGKSQQTDFPPNLSDSNTNTQSPSPTQIALPEGDPIGVKGKNTHFSLHSVDFIDENTGWVVGDVNDPYQLGSWILRTKDGGIHWDIITNLNNMALIRLMFVNKNTGWAIAQTGSETTSDVKSGTFKILHTQDSGKSWDVQWENKVDSPSECGLWFEDTIHGYALVSGTLLSTRDGGKRWSTVSFGLDNFTPQHMSFVDADRGWLIGEIEQKNNSPSSDQNTETRLAVLQTTDGGKLWRQQFERTYSYGPVGSRDINFVNAVTGWFLTSDSATWNGDLYYTANAGQDWKKIKQIKCVRPAPTELDFITPELGWIPLDIGAGPISGGLMLTRDGGKNFEIINGYGGMISISEVDFTSQQQGWAIGRALNYGEYIIHTTDGGKTWTQVYPEIRPTGDISFVDNQHGFGLGQLSDSGALLYTADGGNSWENINSFTQNYSPSMLSFVNRNTGWVVAVSKESDKVIMLKTLDGGKTWTQLGGDFSKIKVLSSGYFRFFDSDNGILIATDAISTTFYRTQDGGRTWQVSEQKPSKGINQFSFVSGKQGWETSSPIGDSVVGFNQMTDGSTWQLVKKIGTNTHSYGIEFISENKGWMLIEEPAYKSDSRKKLMITADGGHTWSSYVFPKGFELESIQSQIPMQFTDDRHGWVLTRYGLLKTEDGGKTWAWK